MRPILLCAGLWLSAIGSAAADDALVAAAKAADSAAALALIQREVDVNVRGSRTARRHCIGRCITATCSSSSG